jgi:hypothetical protein
MWWRHVRTLPSLSAHPDAVMPFLVVRDNFIQRVAHQRTGYWKPDGDGIEVATGFSSQSGCGGQNPHRRDLHGNPTESWDFAPV